MVLVTHNKDQLESMIKELDEAAGKIGLKINYNRTNIMTNQ